MSTDPAAASGLILFAHGARDARWARPFEAVAASLARRRPGLPVRLAYLELMSPTLEQAAQSLVDAGCQEITVLPMFLGAGGHVREDLPRLLRALAERHPRLRLQATAPLGEIPEMVEAIAETSLRLLDAPAAGGEELA